MPQHAPALVLASASPRRRALLARLVPHFKVTNPAVDETPLQGESSHALARRLATAKARAVSRAQPRAAVLAADTVVVVDAEPLGKPADATEARAVLARLRGRVHRVITAVCVVPPGTEPMTHMIETRVRMRDYDDAEIDAYVASGDPLDKAGAHAIQDRRFRPVAQITVLHERRGTSAVFGPRAARYSWGRVDYRRPGRLRAPRGVGAAAYRD